MTCIAGVAQGGRVTIGGDSAGVSGWDLIVRADAKVFRVGEYLLGFTTSFRMGQVLRYAFAPPPPGDDLHRFLCTDFVDALRSALKAAGYAARENERESGGTFLVGVRGRLFRVADDYQVAESAAGYDAVGCGDSVALGALHATGPLGPEARVRAALSAAEQHSAGVRGPFEILTTGPASQT